jgi:hypothetical protein
VTMTDTEIPTIADLVWAADRRSLLELDDETRQLLEKMGDELVNLWPDAPEPELGPQGLEDVIEWDSFVLELVRAGVKAEPEDEPDAEEIVAAVKSTIENARAEGEKDATIPSRANTAQRKAMRLLLEQRVAISVIDLTVPYVLAEVRGDSGVYTCGFHPSRNGWRCTCPEPRGNCSHVAAVKMVVPGAS